MKLYKYRKNGYTKILSFAEVFSRIWCSVLCPTGILLSLAARLRIFRFKVSGKCVKCGKCTQICSIAAAPVDTSVAK